MSPRSCLLACAVVACAATACVGRYHYVEYLPFAASTGVPSRPAFIARPNHERYRELGMFEAYARADDVEDEMRDDILEHAAEVGCDALVAMPTPNHASAPRKRCDHPPPMIRAICIQWVR